MNISEIVKLLRQARKKGSTLWVEYTNSYGVTNEYLIWDVEPNDEYGSGRIDYKGYIDAYCGEKDGESYNDTYTFKIERFEQIEIIEEGEDNDDWDDWDDLDDWE